VKAAVGDLLKYHAAFSDTCSLGIIIEVKEETIIWDKNIRVYWFDGDKPTWENESTFPYDGITIVSRG